MEYGVIGERLGHSFSKDLHRFIGDYRYDLQEVAPEKLQRFIEEKNFKGINVTVPYKVAVLPFLDEIDGRAMAIGAVNTVVNRRGRLYGYNTDFDGLAALIGKLGLSLTGRRVLILGTGGTSRTAGAVAEALGAASIRRVSRHPQPEALTYDEAAKAADTQIIINTTPCGMYPHTGVSPLSLDGFPALEGVVDVVYNPLRSRLVLEAQKRGIPAAGGLYMLVAQAVSGAEKFFGTPQPVGTADRVYGDILNQKSNVVLLGMPGSGKSTVGRLLAQETGLPFIDTDEAITAAAGQTPAAILRSRGEAAFRAEEAAVIRQLSSQTGCIIATGGGAVLDSANVEALRQNGRLIFLDRSPDRLQPTDDRPLSDTREKLTALYEQRRPLYTAAADVCLSNDGTAEEAVAAILTDRKEGYL